MVERATARKRALGKNVLILSAASKVRLVERFKDAAQPFDAQVYVSDLEDCFAAQFFADGTIALPRTKDPSFTTTLIERVRNHDIGLIVPTRDGELQQMAALRGMLLAAGAVVLVPSLQAVQICQDKRRFLQVVEDMGLQGTPCLEHDAITAEDFPLFTRPISGAGGIGARRIDSADDFQSANLDSREMLLHPFINFPEYSVDCLFDLEGQPLQAIARQRQYVVAGESRRSTTVFAPQITDACLRLGAHLELCGHVLFQVFWDGRSEPIFIEANPRFGGASDLSIEAGLNSPRRILQLLHRAHEDAAREEHIIRYGLTMFRYTRDVFFGGSGDAEGA